MRQFIIYIKRCIFCLSMTLGICCYLEITFQFLEGTNPNFRFPWGRYNETLAGVGAILLVIAWFTRVPPPPIDVPAPSADRPKSSN